MNAGDAPIKNRWLKGLFLAFCCWHAGFLVYSIIPSAPARNDPGHPALDFYRLGFSGWQRWNLFDTIPVLHSLDVRFEGKDENGGKITMGCVLPGLKPYPKPELSRYYVLFYRLLFFTEEEPSRDAYLRNAAKILAAHGGPGTGRNWALVMDAEYTRNLYYIRRGGQISAPATKAFDLTNPGAFTP